MDLKERIALIIKENHLKQKELANTIGVSEVYISTLLSGKNKNVSNSVANLVEEKLGYSAKWILSGEGPKYKQISRDPNISDVHRKVIFLIEKMPDQQIKAVLAFIESLEKVESALKENRK